MEDEEQFGEEGDEEIFGPNLDDLLRNASFLELNPTESERIPEIENRKPRELNEKEVRVMGVYEHQEEGLAPTAFVLLKDNQNRQVFIFIGRFEAVAISVALEGSSYPRPMTHDLLKSVIDRLGGTVERIVIDDIWQQTYYAKISISIGKDTVNIDARPSDAVALALRASAPIYMAESVLEQSAIEEEL